MKGQIFTIFLVGAALFLLDVYLAGGFAAAFKKASAATKKKD